MAVVMASCTIGVVCEMQWETLLREKHEWKSQQSFHLIRYMPFYPSCFPEVLQDRKKRVGGVLF